MLSKEEHENGIFKAFQDTMPDFAGEAVTCSRGDKQPHIKKPDFICESGGGRRIGVELGEWLHESQTARAGAFKTLEGEIANEAVKQNFADLLKQYRVLLHRKQEIYQTKAGPKYVFPTKADRRKFKSELFDLLRKFKKTAQPITKKIYLNDFSQVPTLGKFLTKLTVHPVGRASRGIRFDKGNSGDSPKDVRDALIKVARDKCAKYNYRTLKKEQALDELYLVIYYNRASMWNSPYEGINGGIEVAVEQAREQISLDHGPFDKVFLFLAFEPGMRVSTLWP